METNTGRWNVISAEDSPYNLFKQYGWTDNEANLYGGYASWRYDDINYRAEFSPFYLVRSANTMWGARGYYWTASVTTKPTDPSTLYTFSYGPSLYVLTTNYGNPRTYDQLLRCLTQ